MDLANQHRRPRRSARATCQRACARLGDLQRRPYVHVRRQLLACRRRSCATSCAMRRTQQQRPPCGAVLLRHSRHAGLPGASARGRERRDRAEDGGSCRPLRAARLLSCITCCASASRPRKLFRLAKCCAVRGDTDRRDASCTGSRPSTAASSSSSSSARCLPGRPEGRLGYALAQRRLAHASLMPA